MVYDYASSELKRPITVYPILEANVSEYKSYTKGFNAHKELVKDKLFIIEDLYAFAKFVDRTKPSYKKQQEFIQLLLTKTEWEIEFVNGKMVKVL